MKHFVDIERVRETDEELKVNNCQSFSVGDHIVIQTKIDGANSSATWEDGEVKCFSRKNELSPINTLRGFWNYISELDKTMFESNPNWVIFGEWLVKHSITYNVDVINKWYVYDIYDKALQSYLPQTVVKEFCNMWKLNYIETLYDGKFKSWEHVREFLHASSVYGETQEGVVIKNQEHLFGYEVENGRQPSYIKIVNTAFSEVKAHNHEQKVQDPQKLEAKAKAEEIMSTIITEARVRKEINKMIDEGILPEKISTQDMGIVAKNLPRRIMEDCMKEEKEIVYSAGEYCGKAGSVITMNLAKKIILG